jgi:hypothetical protein
MNEKQFRALVRHLTEAAHEAFDNCAVDERPDIYQEFERAMWQDDRDMEKWEATRDEYMDAMSLAYDAWQKIQAVADLHHK